MTTPLGTRGGSFSILKNLIILKKSESPPISLLNSKSVFLKDDTVCISLESGDVYFLTLKKDSMNNVRQFHLEKSASSVCPTTLVKLDNNFLFLGSRLGNSLLLKYEQIVKTSDESENGMETEENFLEAKDDSSSPAAKRKRINTADEWENAPPSEAVVPKRHKSLLEIEEDELASIEGYYGDEIFEKETKVSYNLSTMDSMNNIGPCGGVEIIHSISMNDAYEGEDRNVF